MLLFFIAAAAIPALAAIYFMMRAGHLDKTHKKLLIRTALFGMAGVPIVIGIDFLLKKYVGLDLNLLTSENASELYQFDKKPLEILYNMFTGGIVLKVFLGISAMAFIEEYVKHLVVKEVDWNQKGFNRIIDGVEFSMAAAVGFAFVENVVFFFIIKNHFLDINEILPALMVRAILGTAAHVMFSGIFGYYYGKAKFVGHTRKMHSKHVRKLWHFHVHKAFKVRWYRFKHFIQGKNLHQHIVDELHQDELIAEGLLIAIFLHAIFNFALTLGVGYLVVPFLALEYIFISHEFHVHKNMVVHK